MARRCRRRRRFKQHEGIDQLVIPGEYGIRAGEQQGVSVSAIAVRC
jgi:hypothetical protein